MSDCEEHVKCINQWFRPKITIPSWCRTAGMGDCRTCKPCAENLKCVGYCPAPGFIKVEVEENVDGRHGGLDAYGGVHERFCGDTPDSKTSET